MRVPSSQQFSNGSFISNNSGSVVSLGFPVICVFLLEDGRTTEICSGREINEPFENWWEYGVPLALVIGIDSIS
jgi:hypothetical protein